MASPAVSPLISVVMPVYNGAALVDRALRSVQSQTFGNWELVAVDDASSDASGELLERWAADDPRIRIVRLKARGGPGAARNAAIRAARGQFIAYLEHDDEFFADYLQHVQRLSQRADALVFGYDLVYDDDDSSGRRLSPGEPGIGVAPPASSRTEEEADAQFGVWPTAPWTVRRSRQGDRPHGTPGRCVTGCSP